MEPDQGGGHSEARGKAGADDRGHSTQAGGGPRYGIADVEDMTGISAFTIRYYDKCGFFPDLARNKYGVRSFSDADVAQLFLVDALRKSGLSIEGIQYFVRLSKSNATESERLRILKDQATMLEIQRDEIDQSIERLRAAVRGLSGDGVTGT